MVKIKTNQPFTPPFLPPVFVKDISLHVLKCKSAFNETGPEFVFVLCAFLSSMWYHNYLTQYYKDNVGLTAQI